MTRFRLGLRADFGYKGIMNSQRSPRGRRVIALSWAIALTGCATSQPPPPGITQVGPYQVRFGSMTPAPLAEIADHRPDRYYRYTAEDLAEMEANGDEKEINEDVCTLGNYWSESECVSSNVKDEQRYLNVS